MNDHDDIISVIRDGPQWWQVVVDAQLAPAILRCLDESGSWHLTATQSDGRIRILSRDRPASGDAVNLRSYKALATAGTMLRRQQAKFSEGRPFIARPRRARGGGRRRFDT